MQCVACPHCDLLHAAAFLGDGEEARCVRCGSTLPLPRRRAAVEPGLALAATALVAFVVALYAPLMEMSDLGHSTSTTLPMSALTMWYAGSRATAVVIAICTIVAPAVYLSLLLFIGAGALGRPVPRAVGVAARWARIITPWAMPEVMLLGTLVAFVKIAKLAQAYAGLGMYATAAVAGLLAAARNALDLPTLWSHIDVAEPS